MSTTYQIVFPKDAQGNDPHTQFQIILEQEQGRQGDDDVVASFSCVEDMQKTLQTISDELPDDGLQSDEAISQKILEIGQKNTKHRQWTVSGLDGSKNTPIGTSEALHGCIYSHPARHRH